MKKALCGLIALLVCVSCTGCKKGIDYVETVTCLAEPEPTTAENFSPDYTVEEISGYFDYALMKEIADRKQNTVASPLSVKLALNMAAAGAENETEKELLTLFGYENSEEMQADSKSLVAELNRPDGSITVNNSVWIDNDFNDISESYTGGLADVFNAVTFREKLTNKKIVKKLNGWIDEKTNGLIPKMISEPFKDDTVMLLVNALYFKNEWVHEFEPFNKGYTLTFHGTNGDSETAGMYLEYDGIQYAENEFFRSVSLDYKDGSSMKIYLPEMTDENVLDIVENHTPSELAAAMDMEYSEKKVYIRMPRFECEYGNSLKEILEKMGIFYTFKEGFADLDGMLIENSEEQLYISDVIHAAKLECNEKGTEAAAATIAVTGDGEAIQEEPPIVFTVDKPFIYEIKAPSGETLFLGTICGF
ncbi:MAG: hypothetical protein K2H90_04190 [Oscillospiraceae bacterium]|nr:hypothetical protein [Oscillospiraceae bacterium]